MNNLDVQYQHLLSTILDYGVEKKDRTGVGTKSIFGYAIRHNMQEGFPALTTKNLYFKGVVAELLWFLRGDTNLRYLLKNDCRIWTGDAYKRYEKWYENLIEKYTGDYATFDAKAVALKVDVKNIKKLSESEFENEIMTNDDFNLAFGDLGPIYGKQWRSWNTHENIVIGHNGIHNEWGTVIIDQIREVVETLKTNPDSRRIMVSAWNPGEIKDMVLPPCHYSFQFYTRELTHEEQVQWVMKNTDVELENLYIVEEVAKETTPKRAVSLLWNQRSVDTLLGLPFNIASYGLLLEIIAKEVNMVPDQLIGCLGDTHLYLNHIDAAIEQIGRYYTEDELNEMYPDLKALREEKVRLVKEHKFDAASKLRETEIKMMSELTIHTRQPYALPKLKFTSSKSLFDNLEVTDFELENYQHHKTIKAKLNN